VEKVFGVRPDQVVDVLALMGDASDNIPGVPGVGEKGAKQLVAQYGSLDAVLERAGEISRKSYRESLKSHAAEARLSKDLATIRTDAPIRFDPESLRVRPPDAERLRDLFTRLEFNSFLGELRPGAAASGARYEAVTTASALASFLEEARRAGRVSVDLESTGLDRMRDDILGIALAIRPGEAIYVPIRHVAGVEHQIEPRQALELLRPLLEGEGVGKVGQNLKFDYVLFRRAGVRMAGIAFDTLLAAYLLNPSRSHKLEELAGEHLDYRMIPYEELAGKGAKQVTLDQVDLSRVVEYAGEDADIALRLADRLAPKLEAAGLTRLFERLEIPLLPILAEMEYAGVRIDTGHLKKMSADLTREMARLETSIHNLAGRPFNLNSPRQLGEVLFQDLGIKPRRKTAITKAFSTSQEVLEELAEDHPICAEALEWRTLAKLKGTYVDALPDLVHPETGRVHTTYNQAVAATGRLSSTDPNLQNIPIRTPIGREIRRAFIPADGCLLLAADYNQVELRVLAHLSADPVLIGAFRRGEDIHRRTAAEIFGVAADLVSDEMRRRAKAINFGILYGMGPQRLAREQGMTMRDAQLFIQSYFERFASVREYIERTTAAAEREGQVTTLLARVRHFPELKSENRVARQQAIRAAVNTTIQGSAADLIKLAMIELDRRLAAASLKARMILQVHDELVLEAPEREVEQAAAMAREAMETVFPMAVPLAVDVGWGGNWLEAKGE
jgi:DNA polymerase-1